MHKIFIVATALIGALATSSYVTAHEGHVHRVMGTVAARHDNFLDVKATDGKTSTIRLTEKTKILRGNAKVAAEDIKPGERIVVTASEIKGKDGKAVLLATEVRLAAADATGSR